MKKNAVAFIIISFFSVALVSGTGIHIDPGHSGRVLFTGKQPMTIQWSASINPHNRKQIITTNGKQILAVSGFNEIVCFDADTGSMLWKSTMPEEIKNAPCITGSLGIATSIHGWIRAFDLIRGSSVFTFSEGSDELSTPVLGERNILMKGFLFEQKKAHIFAVDLSKGKTTVIKIPCAFNKQSPTLSSNAVFFAGTKNTNILSYNQDLSQLLWETDIGQAIDNISTRYGFVCVTTMNGKVFLLNRDSGEIIWSKQLSPYILWPASITQNGVVVTTNDASKLIMLDIKNGSMVWQNNIKTDCQPLLDRENIIICLGSSVVFISQNNGEEIWKTQLPSDIIGLPIPVKDQIFAVTSSKKLVSLRTAGYEIILSNKDSQIDLGSATTENPELSTNLTVRNISGTPEKINIQCDSKWLSIAGGQTEIIPFEYTDILVVANLTDMPFGRHTSTIKVTWPNGKIELEISAVKLMDEETIPPKPGILFIPDQKIELTGRLNIGNNMTQTALFNKGELPIKFTIKNSCSWLLPSEYEGTIPGKSSHILYVSVLVGNSQMGENLGSIEVVSPETSQSFLIPVKFVRDYGLEHLVLVLNLKSTVAILNNTKIRVRPAIYKTKDDSVMVPLNLIKLALDADSECFEYEYEQPLYIIRRPDFSLYMRVGENRLFIETKNSRKEIALQSEITLVNGNPVVPLLGIAQALEGEIQIDNEGKKFTLDVFIQELTVPQ